MRFPAQSQLKYFTTETQFRGDHKKCQVKFMSCKSKQRICVRSCRDFLVCDVIQISPGQSRCWQSVQFLFFIKLSVLLCLLSCQGRLDQNRNRNQMKYFHSAAIQHKIYRNSMRYTISPRISVHPSSRKLFQPTPSFIITPKSDDVIISISDFVDTAITRDFS